MFSLLYFALVQEAVFVQLSLSAVADVIVAAGITSVVGMEEQRELQKRLSQPCICAFPASMH